MIDNDRRSYSVFPSSEEDWHGHFDIAFFAIGFESRSRFMIEKLRHRCDRVIGIDLHSPGKHSYDENLAWTKADGMIEILSQKTLSLSEDPEFEFVQHKEMKVAVDVSSMDRRTLSILIFHILNSCDGKRAHIYFVYAPSKFTPPPSKLVPVEFSGPVNDLLAGEPKDPRAPTVMFLGLGYELGLALGVVETFEPAHVLAYVPKGADKRFDRGVNKANLPIFYDGRYVTRIDYNLATSFNALIDIKDRILSTKDHARLVFVPLGPKIFSAMAIVCGYIFWPSLCVWRISSRLDDNGSQREADGSLVGFRLQIDFRPTDTA